MARPKRLIAVDHTVPLPSPKQERYCQYRAQFFPNATALELAGYAGTARPAPVEGAPHVLARIAYLSRDATETVRHGRQELLTWLFSVLRADPRDLVDSATGEIKPPSQWSHDTAQLVEHFDTVKGRTRVKLYSKQQAAERLSAMLGLDKPQQLVVTAAEGQSSSEIMDQLRRQLQDMGVAHLLTDQRVSEPSQIIEAVATITEDK
jgi:Terminase small subunit